jgi:hypothetical protein
MAGVPIIGDVIGFITTPFTAAAGWAWDTVVEGLTDWITKGVLALLTSMWNFMDTASSPKLESEWFYTSASSPFRIAMGIGIAMVSMLVLFALIRGVAAGSPGAVLRTVGHDLPVAIFAMVSLVAVSAAGIDLTDGLSDFIWAQTRDDAMVAMDNLGVTLMTQLPHMHFLGVAVALVLMVAMLFMWVVLFVREALIYLVVIYAVSFGLPSMIFPPLRDTSKKVLELLVALMIAKPVMVLALSVGVSALGGIGSTGQPGDPVGDNMARELGTLVSGAITFGLAAFMPFLVWKLMPIVAAAVVAQGIASAPLRGSAQAMQVQYYGQSAMRRLSGTATSGAAGSSGGRMAAGAPAGSSSGGGSLPGAGVIGGAATSGGVAAAPVAGVVAPVLAAASVAQAAGSVTKSVADSTISASPAGTQVSGARRKLGGDAP